MPRLEYWGYTLVGHTHDELISEVPIGFGSLKEMIAIMCQSTSWSTGIPIDADGFEARRYQKG
jgi:DNA polymerase